VNNKRVPGRKGTASPVSMNTMSIHAGGTAERGNGAPEPKPLHRVHSYEAAPGWWLSQPRNIACRPLDDRLNGDRLRASAPFRIIGVVVFIPVSAQPRRGLRRHGNRGIDGEGAGTGTGPWLADRDCSQLGVETRHITICPVTAPRTSEAQTAVPGLRWRRPTCHQRRARPTPERHHRPTGGPVLRAASWRWTSNSNSDRRQSSSDGAGPHRRWTSRGPWLAAKSQRGHGSRVGRDTHPPSAPAAGRVVALARRRLVSVPGPAPRTAPDVAKGGADRGRCNRPSRADGLYGREGPSGCSAFPSQDLGGKGCGTPEKVIGRFATRRSPPACAAGELRDHSHAYEPTPPTVYTDLSVFAARTPRAASLFSTDGRPSSTTRSQHLLAGRPSPKAEVVHRGHG